jgi:carbohydrate diacid regulator
MPARTDDFERISEVVANRISDLLNACVSVVDDEGRAVTDQSPSMSSADCKQVMRDGGSNYLRVPLTYGKRKGELLISAPTNGEAMSLRVAQTLTELIINQVLAAARLQADYELKNRFIHDLLHGVISDEPDILREGQLLGLDFSRPRAVILIDAANYIMLTGVSSYSESAETRINQRAQWIINSVVKYFRLPSDAICAYIGAGEVAVLKASSTKDLVEWANSAGDNAPLNPSWSNLAALKKASAGLLAHLQKDTNTTLSIGIGRYHPGIAGLARSYEDARAAISLGHRFRGRNGVYCLNELGMAAFVGVSDESTKVDLARFLLGPLDHEPDLLETLQAFFQEDCCPSDTAKRLHIHRNTLSYRLNKIALLSGLNPARFDDAVQMRLALVLRSLGGVA